MLAAVLVLGGVACASAPASCSDVALTRDAKLALEALAAQIDFAPTLPCGYDRGLVVTSVIIDQLPSVQPQARVSFVVDRSTGGRAYVFSQTRAPIASSQIPQSTHQVRVSSGATVAEGFSGPSGSGGEMTYLRWRSNDVTYELDATLGRLLTEAEVQRIAAALMLRGSSQGPLKSGTPSGP